MPEVKWQFWPMSPADINHESMEREFFQGEPVNVRLVREVIQNSLDAALNRGRGQTETVGPVRVRFSLAGIQNPLSADRSAQYFAGLDTHLSALRDDLDDAINSRLAQGGLTSDAVPYIVIEDANTGGLNGDWQQSDDSAENPQEGNDFYWFFRNVGRSGKGDADNGSWGLGKWVFPDVSLINSYIAVTRRSSDGETLLMGQSVLNKHSISGRRYPPYGYFAVHREDGFQQPLEMSNPEHRPFIDQCIADFDLRFRYAPGLSVIIPFPRVDAGDDTEALDKSRLLTAVVRNYFYPIISGHLEVIVDGIGSPVSLNDTTIDGYLTDLDLGDTGEHSAPSYRKLFTMFGEIRRREGDFIELSQPPVDSSGYVHYADLIARRSEYEAGELLAFRISAEVERKNGQRQATAFQLYIQKDDTLSEGHDYYVRGTLSIPEMDYIRRHRARALLIVNEREPLAAMLRDSEPPTHNAWRPQSDRVSKRWISARRRIESVRYSPRELLRILEAPQEGLQKDALADVFSWDGKWGPDIQLPGTEMKERRSNYNRRQLTEKLTRRPPDFVIERVSGGFRVKLPVDNGQTGPLTARLRAAYVTPQGNPLSKYHEQDFQLHGDASLPVAVTGGNAKPGSAGNELQLTIDDPAQFTLTVQGFDRSRDVHIKVERLPAPSGEG